MATQKPTQIEQLTHYARALDRKPFTYKDVMRDLGFCKSRSIIAMSKLKAAGILQEIGKKGEGIYRLAPVLTRFEGSGSDDWTPSTAKLNQIQNAMVPGRNYTAGELSEMCLIPERTLYRYLECLVHIGAVAVRPNAAGKRFCYYRTAQSIKNVPVYSEFRGILGQIRQEWQEAIDAEAEL